MPRGNRDWFFLGLSVAAGAVLGIFLLLVLVTAINGYPIFVVEGVKFLTSNVWIATPSMEEYGIAAPLWGSIYTTILGLAMSIPVSIALVLLVEEVLPGRVREAFAALLDLAAGIPTVVYGLWGAVIIAPLMYKYVMVPLHEYLGWIPLFSFNPVSGYSILTCSVVLACMAVPYMATIIRSAYASIPFKYVEALYALGLYPGEAARIKLGMIKRSIAVAAIIGYGRIIGETIVTTLTIGNVFYLGLSVLAPGYTIPSLIANQFGNAYLYKLMPAALYGAALVLIALSFSFTMLGVWWAERWAEHALR